MLAHDFILIHELKGRIHTTSENDKKVIKMQEKSAKSKQRAEHSFKEMMNHSVKIKAEVKKIEELQQGHLCDNMVSAQKNFLFEQVMDDSYMPASGFIPAEQRFEKRTVTMTEESRTIKRDERPMFSPLGSDSSLKLLPF